MPEPVTRMPVTLYLDASLWRLFQKTCRDHGIKASHEVEAFIKQQLATWQHQPQKESDHA